MFKPYNLPLRGFFFNSNFAMILATTGGEKAGPLVEYERRIASGDLMEGDHFQVKFILVAVACELSFPVLFQ
jgi:hypothetical protein